MANNGSKFGELGYMLTMVANLANCNFNNNIRNYHQRLQRSRSETLGNKINVSAVYLDIYKGDLKWEFTSLLHHEMTHVFQWTGEGKAPVPLIEGIADYTILKANYYPPKAAKPGAGDKWDQGYDFTAQFLKYCDSLVPDFVAKLNKMMRTGYDVSFFKTLTGKPVKQLWKEYKAKYGQKV